MILVYCSPTRKVRRACRAKIENKIIHFRIIDNLYRQNQQCRLGIFPARRLTRFACSIVDVRGGDFFYKLTDKRQIFTLFPTLMAAAVK